MATNTLPPPPVNDSPGSYTWMEWYRQLRNYVSTSGSVPWYIINFTGSNITDIATRSHNSLQTLQGGTSGEMYHLTAAQYASMGIGNHNDLNAKQGGTTNQYYHLTSNQYNAISNSLEVLNTTTSVSSPTTPTALKPTTTVRSSGIAYNSSTGEITFTYGGSYTMNLLINATPTAANQNIYFYATEDTGSGHVIARYTARSQKLTNNSVQQVLFTSSNYFAAGTKLILYVWGDTSGITFNTSDVPGTTAGTVTIPAVRLLWAGSL